MLIRYCRFSPCRHAYELLYAMPDAIIALRFDADAASRLFFAFRHDAILADYYVTATRLIILPCRHLIDISP